MHCNPLKNRDKTIKNYHFNNNKWCQQLILMNLGKLPYA